MLAAILLCLQGLSEPKPLAAGGARPSVVLVVLDDVGAYDVEHVDTPNLRALAAIGMEFRRAYAMPTCASARSSLFFGTYGRYSGNTCEPPGPETPDSTRFSLPKCFESRGYSTLFTGKWHLGTNRLGRPWEETPRLHGFDQVLAGMGQNLADPCDHPGTMGYDRWVRFDRGPSFIETGYNTTVLRDEFLTWWSQTRGPRFAYVGFQGAHTPFHDPPPELVPHPPTTPGMSENRRMFEAMVMSLDTVLGHMLSGIDLRSTYLVVVGDNGTPGNARAPEQQGNRLKGTVFEGGIHVPFLLAGPGVRPGVSDSLVSVVDILPTLAELIRAPLPAGLDGRSLVPVLRNPATMVHDHVFVAEDEGTGPFLRRHRAVVQARYKLKRDDGAETFYDLALDPEETAALDVLALDRSVVQSLRAQMAAYLARGF